LKDLVMEMRISWWINEEVNKEFSSGRFCIQEISLMFCGSSSVSERLYYFTSAAQGSNVFLMQICAKSWFYVSVSLTARK
jgi:hypothetical protein